VTDWAVTVNLGGPRQAALSSQGMLTWTEDTVLEGRRPRLIFAQETFSGWLNLVSNAGYQIIEGASLFGTCVALSRSTETWTCVGLPTLICRTCGITAAT